MARILATIGFLSLTSVAASTAVACTTKEDLMLRLDRELPMADVAVAEADLAEKVAIGIAQRTGSAVPAGGDYLLVDLPDERLTYVVRFAGGCATHHGAFATELVRSWIVGRSVEAGR